MDIISFLAGAGSWERYWTLSNAQHCAFRVVLPVCIKQCIFPFAQRNFINVADPCGTFAKRYF